jgi:hypothetical protein
MVCVYVVDMIMCGHNLWLQTVGLIYVRGGVVVDVFRLWKRSSCFINRNPANVSKLLSAYLIEHSKSSMAQHIHQYKLRADAVVRVQSSYVKSYFKYTCDRYSGIKILSLLKGSNLLAKTLKTLRTHSIFEISIKFLFRLQE